MLDTPRLLATTLLALLSVASGVRADCLDDAARFHGVHPALARAIALQESQMRPDAISPPNSNGSYDIGLMQINSAWLPTLARWGISKTDLLNGCVNAYVGTWILSQNIERLGQNWNAVGAYNANSPTKRLVYAQHIYQRLLQISTPQNGRQMPTSTRVVVAKSSRAAQRSVARDSSIAAYEVGDHE